MCDRAPLPEHDSRNANKKHRDSWPPSLTVTSPKSTSAWAPGSRTCGTIPARPSAPSRSAAVISARPTATLESSSPGPRPSSSRSSRCKSSGDPMTCTPSRYCPPAAGSWSGHWPGSPATATRPRLRTPARPPRDLHLLGHDHRYDPPPRPPGRHHPANSHLSSQAGSNGTALHHDADESGSGLRPRRVHRTEPATVAAGGPVRPGQALPGDQHHHRGMGRWPGRRYGSGHGQRLPEPGSRTHGGTRDRWSRGCRFVASGHGR